MKVPDTKELVRAARRAARKMKSEYDRLEPDAQPDECWAECERLWQALEDFKDIYPYTE